MTRNPRRSDLAGVFSNLQADLSAENLVKVWSSRSSAHALVQHGIRERQARRGLCVDRAFLWCQARRPDDVGLRAAMRDTATEWRQLGYRPIPVLLMKRDGHVVNHKKRRGLYQEQGLQPCKRGCHKGALGTRRPCIDRGHIGQVPGLCKARGSPRRSIGPGGRKQGLAGRTP